MTTARDLLHKNKLDEFKAFLKDGDWVEEPPVGEFEVARFRHKRWTAPLLVYRSKNQEHLTVHGVAYKFAVQFIRQQRLITGKQKAPNDADHSRP